MKRQRKRTRIDAVREETEKALLERGADFGSTAYNDRRFICHYIVNHSFLSLALKHLGVFEAKDIMKCYGKMPGVSFYKYVMWAYYIKRMCPDMMPDIPNLFGVGYNRDLYELVKDTYYEMRQRLYQDRVQSMNAQGAQNATLKKRLREMLTCGLATEAFIEEYSYTGLRGLYIVARLLRGESTHGDLKGYVEDNLDEIVADFQKNGYTRSLLSNFHGISIPCISMGECVATGTAYANDDIIRSTIGLSHDELNHMATEYQDSISRKLHLMANWEYLDNPEPYFDIEGTTEDMLEELENSEVLTAGSLTEDVVPKQVMGLARKLSRIHGPVKITSESSGMHICIADPDLLREDGQKELVSKHLSINADKYFGIGQWDVDVHPTTENRSLYNRFRREDKEIPCALSMKTGKAYMVSDLLHYTPIHKRSGLFENVKPDIIVGSTNKRLVYDENGNLVPEWVGHTIPLTQLPRNHPAVEYLTLRGYNLESLVQQFEACYCDEALPESRAEGRWYSRLPGGMKNSPQGRIIFVVRMNGVRHGYQSRYIDKWNGSLHYFWSDSQKWELIEWRMNDGSVTQVYPPDDIFRKGFAPHKYINALGSERNKLLMGFDAAVAANADRPKNKRFCILVEGPLDAARLGPPAIALLGKSLSTFQAECIKREFTHVLTVMDNDKAGRMGLARIHSMLEHNPITDIQLPAGVKDVGELSYAAAYELIKPYIP